MRASHSWADPTAGVTLAPTILECPRCGVAKGIKGKDRPGLCHDCRDVLPTHADRAPWRVAA